jgi:hypothetical protein
MFVLKEQLGPQCTILMKAYILIFWRENSSLIKIWQEWRVLNIKTYVKFCYYMSNSSYD